MICEICAIDGKINDDVRHTYTYEPTGLAKQHHYCEKHFVEFCKMVAEEES